MKKHLSAIIIILLSALIIVGCTAPAAGDNLVGRWRGYDSSDTYIDITFFDDGIFSDNHNQTTGDYSKTDDQLRLSFNPLDRSGTTVFGYTIERDVLTLTYSNGTISLSKSEVPLPPARGSSSVVVDAELVQDIRDALRVDAESQHGAYTLSMSTYWTFERWDSPSADAIIGNDARNNVVVYIDVNLDDGRLVYSSPFIPIGGELSMFALDEPLPAGIYPSTVTYFLMDDDLENAVSEVYTGVTITIEND